MGTLVVGRNELLLLRMISKEWFFQIGDLLLLNVSNDFRHTLHGQPFCFLVIDAMKYLYWRCFLSWGLSVRFSTVLFFLESFVQKTHLTIRRLLFCYKRFSAVRRKSRKKSLQFCSVQQVVLKLRKRKFHPVRTGKSEYKSDFEP